MDERLKASVKQQTNESLEDSKRILAIMIGFAVAVCLIGLAAIATGQI